MFDKTYNLIHYMFSFIFQYSLQSISFPFSNIYHCSRSFSRHAYFFIIPPDAHFLAIGLGIQLILQIPLLLILHPRKLWIQYLQLLLILLISLHQFIELVLIRLLSSVINWLTITLHILIIIIFALVSIIFFIVIHFHFFLTYNHFLRIRDDGSCSLLGVGLLIKCVKLSFQNDRLLRIRIIEYLWFLLKIRVFGFLRRLNV